MSCNSALYAANTTTGTPVAAGGTVPLTQVVRRFGCGAVLNGDAVTVKGRGYYDIDATVSVAATAAGAVTVSLLKDGQQVPGAPATVTAKAAGDIVTLPISAMVKVFCCAEDRANLTLVVTDQAVTTVNAAVVAQKV